MQWKRRSGEDLPPDPSNTIAQQPHHTHCVALPVKGTMKGPTFSPVKTAFELPNGKKQPFIHAMYEKDTVVEGTSWPEQIPPYGG